MAASMERGESVAATEGEPPARKTPLEQYGFSFQDFLKKEYRFGIDPSRPICKPFREGFCPLGSSCPDRHIATRSYNSLVCKHWLRGLCKKGDACDFDHNYNLRSMPECSQYSRTLYCSNGDDCIYLHKDAASKLPSCPHYEKGFCPLGPRCSRQHIRKTMCKFYLAGFCPYGRKCKEGAHPRWIENLPKPTVRVEKTAEEIETERARIREEAEREEEREWERRDAGRRDGRGRGRKGFSGPRRRGGYDR
ncbi:RNA-binding component of cleavage and polyadenylation factor [Agyrium rufum]|nr:RNA-binding component of cleavage and polyadenylation factor [Agyrium rufum]